MEKYISENFGFREAVIRLYNQYVWSLFDKTYCDNVVIGKDKWLFNEKSVKDHYESLTYEYAKSEEELIRALVLSHLTVIYIKQSLGRLSALCGCVVAATGSSCGITYLMGGNYEQVTYAVKNMIANITGMICDGAKPSCALKLTSGVSTAVLSAILAMEGKCVTSVEGIIDDDVDRSIRNLTRIGSQGMNETDKLVLDIMTHKQCD